VRINVRRLATLLFVSLLVPFGVALTLDVALGWLPLATIVTAVVFIPLSTVIVVRATLAELDVLIQAVAPLPAESSEANSS
jgi:hypothetical protein